MLQKRRARGDAAPALDRRVDPDPLLTFHWNAYHDLSDARPVGMGIAAIPITEIAAWARIYGVRNMRVFLRIIRAMDRVEREIANSKTPQGGDDG